MLVLLPLVVMGLALHAAFRGNEVYRMLPEPSAPPRIHYVDEIPYVLGRIVPTKPAVLVSFNEAEKRMSVFSHDNFTIYTSVWPKGASLFEKISVLHDLAEWAQTLNVTLEAEFLPQDGEDDLAWHLSREGGAF